MQQNRGVLGVAAFQKWHGQDKAETQQEGGTSRVKSHVVQGRV